ncbi:hypothetical protein EJB05_44299, partial [Eragrostis curvula]
MQAPRRRRRRFKDAVTLHVSVFNAPPPPPPPVEERDWSELPRDTLLYVLGKLDAFELLTGGAPVVCRSWRHAACKEPGLWRRIDMDAFYLAARRWRPSSPTVVARQALRLSAGQCQAFHCLYDVDDDFLLFLSEQAPSLKSLHLNMCNHVSNKGFVKAIQKFPLLEELDIDLCPYVCAKGVFELVAKTCPLLKHFGHTKGSDYYDRSRGDDHWEASAIARMKKLRSLKLFRVNLTNEELTTILDNCLQLESLDIRNCRKIKMDSALRAKCPRILTKKLLLYECTDEVEDFQPGSPISFCSSCIMFGQITDNDDSSDVSDSEDSIDYSDSDDYFSAAEEIDLHQHERIIDKTILRYL